ncbi:MAG: rhomboid family intramembrane serine protease [Wenzhouxiangellaceae bacterium]|nr:rhomboid family intramembrane serine protease [Wenzhouxiangellaceae bacterium]
MRTNLNGRKTVMQPPAALIILGATVVAFLLQSMNPIEWMRLLALWPLGTPDQVRFADTGVLDTGFGPWQLVTYALLHGGIGHLFFNMFALYMFGLPIEQAWGSRRFVIYYLVCVIGAGIVQLATAAITGGVYPTIGASGGVFGLLLAFGVMYPNQKILLLIPPIPIKAKYFVIFYGLLTLFFGITGTAAGVAHFAHLGGMAFGLLMILYWGRGDYHRRS